MTLQNRVTPFGGIVAAPERGTLMGNRGGCIHDDQKRLTGRRWVSERWIACRLVYKDWHRQVMAPRQYTELFFLDEATAFAAGHRPCALCRHEDHLRFREAWLAGNPGAGVGPGDSISAIDRVLHGERPVSRRPRGAELPAATLDGLPAGAFVVREESPDEALFWHGGILHRWTPGGYERGPRVRGLGRLRLLTAPSLVRAFAAGYAPGVHPSLSDRDSPRP